ncbi:MAG TPA: erythromycin esterase family protein [Rhizomicrobium sp.]|nr:erythromycin esterase family protein [Rhizomicrobium sp.]
MRLWGDRSAGPRLASVDKWIAREAIPFSFDRNFDAAVDRMMQGLGDQVSLLGIGEALHGGEEFFVLRNRLFQRLVEAHGFSAITLETNDPRARLVDAYISGRGPADYEAIEDDGFSYGAGRYAANRELVEWMKRYNSDPAHSVKLNFYGTLPSPQGTPLESPRQALEQALAYLKSVDAAAAARYGAIIEPLLGPNADWEDAAAAIEKEMMARLLGGDSADSLRPGSAAPDPTKEVGLSPEAQTLRLAVENFAFELQMRRPELVAKSNRESFNAAQHDLFVARNLLALHAALARRESLDTLVSMRDAMAAEYLVYIADREQARGKVLVHLHNAHLRRTRTKLPWYEFWPTGAHLEQLFGQRFALIGGALGTSEANFIGAPEPGSLEARLLALKANCFIPARRGKPLAGGVPPVRTGSTNPMVPYTPLSSESVADFDVIAFLRSTGYTRGAAPLSG